MKILVTSALPYANGDIHLGHLAGAYLPADIYVRYQRLKGRDVIHICGTDEHGVPITVMADQQKKSPKDIVDFYHQSIKRSFEEFGIIFDNFSRTTLPLHYKLAQDFFLKIYSQGFIYPKEIEQFYCPRCNRFLPDRYIVGRCPRCGIDGAKGDQCENCGRWLEPFQLIQPRCLICGAEPQKQKTTHWYFRLSQFQDRLAKWIEEKKDWKETVLTAVQGWLKEGLEDRPITRDMSWGVPVPLDEAKGKVLYVWFDAPIGYISSTMEWAEKKGEPDLWKEYWLNPETQLIHFIGKDNIVFHALIWPAMLMAYGDYILPSQIPANQFLNLEGEKLSTSRNYAIWLPEYLKDFPPDSLRYALSRNLPETRDSDFAWRDFQTWHNNELADILGNFVNRVLAFINKYYNSNVPTASSFTERENRILDLLHQAPRVIGEKIEKFEFKSALQEVLRIAQEGNRYFDYEEPWITRKTNPLICERTMYICMKMITSLAVLSEPFLPFTSRKIKEMINFKEQKWDEIGTPIVSPNIGKVEVLFQKIDDHIINLQIAKLKQKEITIEEFNKIELRAAKVLSAQMVPGSDQLLHIEVEIGKEKKQIVAKIGKHYRPEELVGRTIIVVNNLKPVVLKGVLSQGMLLAAQDKDSLVLLTTDKPIASGAKVT
uniref:Methionine--tRNA ligase n=1 Tax=candidate division WOR-3 bacterium TaxID=2052148 RepID=A0A7C4THM6_UNCW3